MNKYVKGKTIIYATEKAYNLIYKEKGFVPYAEKETKSNKAKDTDPVKDENNENPTTPENVDENNTNSDVTAGE